VSQGVVGAGRVAVPSRQHHRPMGSDKQRLGPVLRLTVALVCCHCLIIKENPPAITGKQRGAGHRQAISQATFAVKGRKRRSEAQEDFPLIEEVHQPERQQQAHD
jgi:hypothetical protein